MARWAKQRGRAARLSATALALITMGLTGCGGSPPASPQAAGESDPIPHATPPDTPKIDPSPEAINAPRVKRDRLHQPFADATRAADNPPEDSQRPPDRTATDKAVFKLLEQVQSLWDTVRFVTPDGKKKLEYSATIETTMGTIEIALFPEAAPNHVRNFVTLAKAGYYDGLCIDGILHEEVQDEGEAPLKLDQVRGGCPLGTGETGVGSIGYWLRPEYLTEEYKSAKLTHEPGILSACRGSEPDSAATRFAITLSKAPYLDDSYTIFGKVVKGLDVVRTMSLVPVIIDDSERDGSRQPEKRIVIRSVTIHTREGDPVSGTEGTH
jgi:peptidyl-prolyl cis-trans isomerase B (cyclophilin B)